MNKLIGNAVIGQSGGPTAAINATLSGVVRGCKEADCIGKIYGAINGIEGVLAERFCDLGEKLPDEASPRTTPQPLKSSLKSSKNTTSATSSISAETTRWIPSQSSPAIAPPSALICV